jgi:hypothetical protein
MILTEWCTYLCINADRRHANEKKLSLHTVIRFVWGSAKFGTCTVVSVNGTLVEDKMRGFKSEYAHFRSNKCPNYTQDGASAKFNTISQETDNSAPTHTTAQVFQKIYGSYI